MSESDAEAPKPVQPKTNPTTEATEKNLRTVDELRASFNLLSRKLTSEVEPATVFLVKS